MTSSLVRFSFRKAAASFAALALCVSSAHAQTAAEKLKAAEEASNQEAQKYSAAPYQTVFKLPDAMPTILDPVSAGEKMNLFGAEIEDSGWIKPLTTVSWEAQGLGFWRKGSIWYRVRFPVAQDLSSGGIGLFLGAFQDEAKVWVNEKFVGTTGVKFPNSAVIDLTDNIRFGQENLVAIEIKRNAKIDGMALGGILRPSFIFAGPRVGK